MATWRNGDSVVDVTILHTSVPGDIGYDEKKKGRQTTIQMEDGSSRAVDTMTVDPMGKAPPKPAPKAEPAKASGEAFDHDKDGKPGGSVAKAKAKVEKVDDAKAELARRDAMQAQTTQKTSPGTSPNPQGFVGGPKPK